MKYGQGKFEYTDGTYHEGFFLFDKFSDGNGTLKYADGSVYEGEIRSEQKHGEGLLTFADGTS